LEYQFKTIESLIRSAIETGAKSDRSLDEQFAQVRSAVAEERDRFKRSFALLFWALETDQLRRNYLQLQLWGLTALIDALYKVQNERSESEKATEARLRNEAFFLNDQLDDLLSFLHDNFQDYVDPDSKIPEPRRIKVAGDMQKAYAKVLYPSVASEQLTIVKKAATDIIEGRQLTYRRFSMSL